MSGESAPRIRLFSLAALTAVVVSASASGAVACPASTRSSDAQALVKVVHVEEGDGPTTWTLIGYTDGVLELAKLGKSPRCRKIPRRELEALIHLVEEEQFQNAAEFAGFLGHQEWMQVIHRDTVRRFVAKDLPPEIVSVFKELDRLFSKEFGRRYSWPLIGSASGPRASAAEPRR